MNVTIDGKKVAVSDVYEVITNKEVEYMVDSGYADHEYTVKVYPDDDNVSYHWKERMTVRRLQQFMWNKRFNGSLVLS
tara:strand:- start:729 stop:962 length:234 start_codon:yes stop_codon:yes gene_type:complete